MTAFYPSDQYGFSTLLPDGELAALGRLPGRKFVHTNGNADYAWKVLDRLGIAAVVLLVIRCRGSRRAGSGSAGTWPDDAVASSYKGIHLLSNC
mgnify:CR=1 FL=1